MLRDPLFTLLYKNSEVVDFHYEYKYMSNFQFMFYLASPIFNFHLIFDHDRYEKSPARHYTDMT